MATLKGPVSQAWEAIRNQGIPVSPIDLNREGLVINGENKQSYSFYAPLDALSQEDIGAIYDAAHKNGLRASLNRLHHPEEGTSEIVVEVE